MIFNLLLVDPDNIADGGYDPIDTTTTLILVLTLLGIIVTIVSAVLIFKLCQKLQTEKKKAIFISIIITAIVILILFTVLGVQAFNAHINS